jgi:hypothetical protein
MGKMVGQTTYTRPQLKFLLDRLFPKPPEKKPPKEVIIKEYLNEYGRVLNDVQIRYVSNKYSKDPAFK